MRVGFEKHVEYIIKFIYIYMIDYSLWSCGFLKVLVSIAIKNSGSSGRSDQIKINQNN